MRRAAVHRLLILAIPLLWVAALASAAGAIYSKHRARELFVELERLNVQRDNLEIEWGQLQLEQSAWSTHAFVENVAGAKLKMAHAAAEGHRAGVAVKVFQASAANARRAAAAKAARARDDPRSFRWRANFVLALLVCGALGLVVARRRAAAQGSRVPRGPGRRALLARGGDHRDPRHHHRSLRRAARGVHAGRFGVGESRRSSRWPATSCRGSPRR